MNPQTERDKRSREFGEKFGRKFGETCPDTFGGRRYLLKVLEHNAPSSIEIRHRQLVLRVRDPSSETEKLAALDNWYRVLAQEPLWQPFLAAMPPGPNPGAGFNGAAPAAAVGELR